MIQLSFFIVLIFPLEDLILVFVGIASRQASRTIKV